MGEGQGLEQEGAFLLFLLQKCKHNSEVKGHIENRLQARFGPQTADRRPLFQIFWDYNCSITLVLNSEYGNKENVTRSLIPTPTISFCVLGAPHTTTPKAPLCSFSHSALWKGSSDKMPNLGKIIMHTWLCSTLLPLRYVLTIHSFNKELCISDTLLDTGIATVDKTDKSPVQSNRRCRKQHNNNNYF